MDGRMDRQSWTGASYSCYLLGTYHVLDTMLHISLLHFLRQPCKLALLFGFTVKQVQLGDSPKCTPLESDSTSVQALRQASPALWLSCNATQFLEEPS